jgi:hypothetical protein
MSGFCQPPRTSDGFACTDYDDEVLVSPQFLEPPQGLEILIERLE